ncbi:bifunctional nicotinamide-nucleotide adenylyltransferase/Nudix hydroxylase [Thiotrichales bacterium 19S3-7]|nr:bifunctional nicotinamide-nucleotide adenylyltransferase/Nudix hydroxylase [Thiotrichales bacterium 19S3-7]MCF6802433.1 bifunctional nicotinamide-nucleotide adenylyltransferase/Nudix hydroxylase [Thiotrichales bacterium 19S3-11]
MKYSFGVFIGRFQPLHTGHLHVINHALTQCQKLILLVGSSNRARSIRNPFSFKERKQMILADLQSTGIDIERILLEPVDDYYYDEQAWIDDVKIAVNRHINTNDKVVLVGHNKDSSSYYLALFPNWQYQEVDNFKQLNATEFRNDYFIEGKLTKGYLIKGQAGYAIDGAYSFLLKFEQTASYQLLKEEYIYVSAYKESWRGVPYPVIFNTLDSLVICCEHILLIKRGGLPGKDQYALPGGFLEVDERITSGILRELAEETQLKLSQKEINFIEYFDHPERSVLGRVITHLGVFDLAQEKLPKVHAADDAKDVMWISFDELYALRDQFFDDHYQIIRYSLKRLKKVL